MNELTTFTGVGIPTDFAKGPVLIIAGSTEILKEYLGHGPDYSQACLVSVTVGPHAEAQAIELKSMAGLLAAKAFAEKLIDRQYGEELTPPEEEEARAAGLVVVFGASDDLAEFRGAIRDEAGIGAIRITTNGKFLEDERMDALKELVDEGVLSESDLPKFGVIIARHTESGHSYDTSIPHAKFTVTEDGEHFGEGIVFHLSDLTT